MVRDIRIFFVMLTALVISAQNVEQISPRELLIKQVEEAFLARDLGRISNPSNTIVVVVIEHSIIPPPKGLVRAEFSNFHQAERWLQSRERNLDLPPGEYWPLRFVRNGKFTKPNIFEYDNMGISHNSWNLSKIYFSIHNGTYYVGKLVIYDGD